MFRLGLHGLHVVFDAWEALEIRFDVGGRFPARDAKLRAKSNGGDAVNDSEIDCLSAPPNAGVHALNRHIEHFRRRHGVNIETISESLTQRRCVGHMGEDAQFDLAVVRADQCFARFCHEGFANFASLHRAHGDVLQVGLLTSQTARGGRRQDIAGMDAPRIGVDIGWQCIRIRTF